MAKKVTTMCSVFISNYVRVKFCIILKYISMYFTILLHMFLIPY